jgi:hypothetical protein
MALCDFHLRTVCAFEQNLLAPPLTHPRSWLAVAHADHTVAEVVVSGIARVACSHAQHQHYQDGEERPELAEAGWHYSRRPVL